MSTKVISKIGSGSTCNVYKVQIDDKEYAMKCIHRDCGETVDDEIFILKKINHPNILHAESIFKNIRGQYCFLYPYHICSLDQIEESVWNSIPFNTKYLWFIDIVNACIKLKEYGYYHGDIHPKNILINIEGRAVLSDFGLSKVYDKDMKKREVYGSFPYCSPISFCENLWFHDKCSKEDAEFTLQDIYIKCSTEGKLAIPFIPSFETPYQADIFSLGLLLSFLCCPKQQNFLQSNTKYNDILDVRANITRYILNPYMYLSLIENPLPICLEKLILQCCSVNPDLRPELELIQSVTVYNLSQDLSKRIIP